MGRWGFVVFVLKFLFENFNLGIGSEILNQEMIKFDDYI